MSPYTAAARPCSRCVKFFDSRTGAVDGHRLALSRDESLRVEAPFYIPPEAIRLLPVLGKTVCRLSVGARHAAFDSGTVRVITRIPEGAGLDFDAVIPGSCLEEQTVDVADFAGSLRYLNEFICNPGHEAVRFDGGVLSVKNARGEYRSRLELSGASQAVIGFDGGYMLDGLKQFQIKDLRAVIMRLSGPTEPPKTPGTGRSSRRSARICPAKTRHNRMTNSAPLGASPRGLWAGFTAPAVSLQEVSLWNIRQRPENPPPRSGFTRWSGSGMSL